MANVKRSLEEPNDETVAAMKAADQGELLVANDVSELLRQSGISCVTRIHLIRTGTYRITKELRSWK